MRGEVYMPIAAFDDLNRRQAEAGRAALRESAQLGRRLAAPEGPGGDGRPGAVVLGLPGGGGAARAVGRRRPANPSWPPASRPPWRGSVGPGSRSTPRLHLVHGLDDVLAFCARWEEHRHDLGYEIDGVVVKVDDLDLQR